MSQRAQESWEEKHGVGSEVEAPRPRGCRSKAEQLHAMCVVLRRIVSMTNYAAVTGSFFQSVLPSHRLRIDAPL